MANKIQVVAISPVEIHAGDKVGFSFRAPNGATLYLSFYRPSGALVEQQCLTQALTNTIGSVAFFVTNLTFQPRGYKVQKLKVVVTGVLPKGAETIAPLSFLIEVLPKRLELTPVKPSEPKYSLGIPVSGWAGDLIELVFKTEPHAELEVTVTSNRLEVGFVSTIWGLADANGIAAITFTAPDVDWTDFSRDELFDAVQYYQVWAKAYVGQAEGQILFAMALGPSYYRTPRSKDLELGMSRFRTQGEVRLGYQVASASNSGMAVIAPSYKHGLRFGLLGISTARKSRWVHIRAYNSSGLLLSERVHVKACGPNRFIGAEVEIPYPSDTHDFDVIIIHVSTDNKTLLVDDDGNVDTEYAEGVAFRDCVLYIPTYLEPKTWGQA